MSALPDLCLFDDKEIMPVYEDPGRGVLRTGSQCAAHRQLLDGVRALPPG
jgi:hypothetical protein